MKKFLICLLFLITLMNITEASENDVVSVDLEESIHIALENNHSIKQSIENQKAAEWSLEESKRQTGANLQYEMSAEGVGGKRKHKDYQNDDYDRNFSHSLSLSIPIYSGGKFESEQKAATFALNSAELELEMIKQDVKFKTTKAYYNILLCREMIIINEEAVNELEDYLKRAKNEFDLGHKPKADILASTVQLANTKKNLRNTILHG